MSAGDRREGRALPLADKLRLAFGPAWIALGVAMLARFVAPSEEAPREAIVLLLGLAFVAFGGYRLWLARRALRAYRDRS